MKVVIIRQYSFTHFNYSIAKNFAISSKDLQLRKEFESFSKYINKVENLFGYLIEYTKYMETDFEINNKRNQLKSYTKRKDQIKY